jgi:hypothetical protein
MKFHIGGALRFFWKYGGPVGYLKKYGRILKSYGQAWDTGNIENILEHFDENFVYTDCIAQSGIHTKPELRNHLEKVFERYPRQKWTTNATLYPHYTLYRFAISYEFRLDGEERILTGTGMEKMTFNGEKLIEDRIHMIINELDARQSLGFKT